MIHRQIGKINRRHGLQSNFYYRAIFSIAILIYCSDSDSDSQNNEKRPDTSARPTQSGFSGKNKMPFTSKSTAANGPEKSSYKNPHPSSPSRPRINVSNWSASN